MTGRLAQKNWFFLLWVAAVSGWVCADHSEFLLWLCPLICSIPGFHFRWQMTSALGRELWNWGRILHTDVFGDKFDARDYCTLVVLPRLSSSSKNLVPMFRSAKRRTVKHSCTAEPLAHKYQRWLHSRSSEYISSPARDIRFVCYGVSVGRWGPIYMMMSCHLTITQWVRLCICILGFNSQRGVLPLSHARV